MKAETVVLQESLAADMGNASQEDHDALERVSSVLQAHSKKFADEGIDDPLVIVSPG